MEDHVTQAEYSTQDKVRKEGTKEAKKTSNRQNNNCVRDQNKKKKENGTLNPLHEMS